MTDSSDHQAESDYRLKVTEPTALTTALTIMEPGGEALLTIHRDGRWEFRDDAAPTEAARVFVREAMRIVGGSTDAGRGYWPEEAHRLQRQRNAALSRAEAAEARVAELERAVDAVRRRHPHGDEDGGVLPPGLWCPGCGRERADGGWGACPDRAALDGEATNR